MVAFERMWARLPDVLKSEDTKGLYTALGDIFDLLEMEQQPYIYVNVLSLMTGKMLDLYGFTFGIGRGSLNDESYKRKLVIELTKLKFVPTLNEFINFIKKVTGYNVSIVEGWKLVPPEKASLKISITIPAGSDDSLLFDLKSIYSSGIKIEFEKRQETFTPLEFIGQHNVVGVDKIYRGERRNLDEAQRIKNKEGVLNEK